MPEPHTRVASSVRGSVRFLDVDARDSSTVANAIEDMYDNTLDVIVVRGAFDPEPLAEVGERLDLDGNDPGWSRPNEKMPVEDVQLLGTDTPATPTFRSPRGTSLDAYLSSAAAHGGEAAAVFKPGFDAAHEIRAVLSRFAGERPVESARAGDGRAYSPFTIRRLADGKQIGVHHDYHYRLDLYSELAQQVDTGTLISYVATLRSARAGGELLVYSATSDAPDLPKLPNGYSYDLAAIEARYDCASVATNPGDLFLLASGRCLHRVSRIAGPPSRITMGGFLALDRSRERVLFWS